MNYKVVHVITGLNTGGAEKMLLKLVSRMYPEMCDITVVSLIDKGTVGPDIEKLGIKVIEINMNSGFGAMLPAILKLRKIIKREKADIVQGWMYHANLLATLACPFRKVVWNVRHSLTDIEHEKRSTRLVIRICRFLSAFPKAIIYNSNASLQQHESFGFSSKNSMFLPNGFDDDAFNSTDDERVRYRKELGYNDDDFIVGLIARYHEMKGHEIFFHAASILVKSYANAKLILAGENIDSSNKKITNMIDKYDLQGYVCLMGELKDVRKLTSILDVACSSSRWGEGFSNSIGEALLMGKVCVVTDVGDGKELVGDSGIVVSPDSYEEFGAALKEIADWNYADRMNKGKLAQDRMKSQFSITRIANKYKSLYQSL